MPSLAPAPGKGGLAGAADEADLSVYFSRRSRALGASCGGRALIECPGLGSSGSGLIECTDRGGDGRSLTIEISGVLGAEATSSSGPGVVGCVANMGGGGCGGGSESGAWPPRCPEAWWLGVIGWWCIGAGSHPLGWRGSGSSLINPISVPRASSRASISASISLVNDGTGVWREECRVPSLWWLAVEGGRLWPGPGPPSPAAK